MSIDKVLNKKHFYGKIMQKICTNSWSLTPFLFWYITQSSHCMQEILLKIRYFERGLSKTLKKVSFIFLLNPVPFNGQRYQKQKGPGIREQSLFRLQNKSLFRVQNKFTKISLLIMYYLTNSYGVI